MKITDILDEAAAISYSDFGPMNKDVFRKYLLKIVDEIESGNKVLDKYLRFPSCQPIKQEFELAIKKMDAIANKVANLTESREYLFDLSNIEHTFGLMKKNLQRRIPAIESAAKTKIAQEILAVVTGIHSKLVAAIDAVENPQKAAKPGLLSRMGLAKD